MKTTRLILVGGFLGAGKTTLLAQAARQLSERGNRVGLIANDQAPDLVDTALLRDTGSAVEEVAGGCFCCRFPDLLSAMERLVRQVDPDVLIGEPVGSCTDLSATVLQPLKKLHGQRFHLAPFSVVVDGKQVRVLDRLQRAAAERKPGGFPDDVLYIYQKQLEEADVIVLNKVDLLPPAELEELKRSLAARLPETPILTMSALGGEGVEAWLDFLWQDRPAGRKITPVDYDTYAAGEAALGWMNASATLRAHADTDWQAFARDLLEAIRGELGAAGAEIAHLKLYLTANRAHVVGNLTSGDAPLSLRGSMDRSVREASLLINARVHTQPGLLRATVENCLQATTKGRIEATIGAMRSFFPGRPEPTFRFDSVV